MGLNRRPMWTFVTAERNRFVNKCPLLYLNQARLACLFWDFCNPLTAELNVTVFQQVAF